MTPGRHGRHNGGMDPSFVEALGTVVLVAGGTAVAGTAAVAGSVWYGVRRLRRSRRVRRGLDRGSTVARALTSDASGRRLAGMRLRVERSIDATEQTFRNAAAGRRPTGQLPAIAGELRESGRDLSEQLRVAEADPDPQIRARLAQEFDEPVERFLRISGDLRAAAVAGGRELSGTRLGEVSQRLGLEIAALEVWDPVYARPHENTVRGSHRVEGGA